MAYVTINARIDEKTRRVLGVVKEKYGLRDVGRAIDKFVGKYGSEEVEPEVNEELVRELIASSERHIKKYGFKQTSLEELRKLSGLK